MISRKGAKVNDFFSTIHFCFWVAISSAMAGENILPFEKCTGEKYFLDFRQISRQFPTPITICKRFVEKLQP